MWGCILDVLVGLCSGLFADLDDPGCPDGPLFPYSVCAELVDVIDDLFGGLGGWVLLAHPFGRSFDVVLHALCLCFRLARCVFCAGVALDLDVVVLIQSCKL